MFQKEKIVRLFEYKVFNLSEAYDFDSLGKPIPKRDAQGKEITFVDVLNEHGRQGWQVLFPITETKQSYLMMRDKHD